MDIVLAIIIGLGPPFILYAYLILDEGVNLYTCSHPMNK